MVSNELQRQARLDVLFTGYAALPAVAGTVSLIRDGDRVIVVDPGMVPSRAAILDPLRELGVTPGDVTDVVLSHHHPDHTLNVALFGEVPVHDFQAVYTRTTGSDVPLTACSSARQSGSWPRPGTRRRT